MVTKTWAPIKDTVSGFIEHEDLTRGAAIAYYTIFSIAPLLIIVIATRQIAHPLRCSPHGNAGRQSRAEQILADAKQNNELAFL
jgi:hypothetical protein